MNKRLPFYKIYQQEREAKEQVPIWGLNNMNSFLYDDKFENEKNMSRRDYDYMKSAYPDAAKRIMPYVEEACERLEYSGSVMFDEYPDQLQLRLLCRRIYRKVIDKEQWGEIRNSEGNLREKNWLYELVQVMTWQEVLRRRSEYRNYRRKFY